ncbi:MAG: N-acetylmuramoyl-L-alanine amidase [Chloroflexales bacterium]
MSKPLSNRHLPARVTIFLVLLLLMSVLMFEQTPNETSPTTVYAAKEVTAPPAPPTPTEPPMPTPTSTPDPAATPTPRAPGTAFRVGLQAGHLRSNELPEELAHLRSSSGSHWGNLSEAALNLDIITRVKPLLEAQGVVVDILLATVPTSYDADLFLALHADGSASGSAHGWKLATPWRASAASKLFLATMSAAYGPATGLTEDAGGVTFNMKGYYAFNFRRYISAIARTTPAIILEMGFLTSATDRAVIINQPDRVARGIADGILAYLQQRNPADGGALLPPEYPVLRIAAQGATLRAAPRDNARVLAQLSADTRLMPFDLQDGYYQVFVHTSKSRTVGWVREDEVSVTDEQPDFPTPVSQ